ncbi:unnamed protein product [Ectocarpus sp. CCAP 1310/34]|nr:unnamed protein product [Ectocarpus sp. CCAP 1310/34]
MEKWVSFTRPAPASRDGRASPTSSISERVRQHHAMCTSGTEAPSAAATHQS